MNTIIIIVVCALVLFSVEFVCIRKHDNRVNQIKTQELETYKSKYLSLRELVIPEE